MQQEATAINNVDEFKKEFESLKTTTVATDFHAKLTELRSRMTPEALEHDEKLKRFSKEIDKLLNDMRTVKQDSISFFRFLEKQPSKKDLSYSARCDVLAKEFDKKS